MALIVALLVAATAVVVTVNVALEVPAITVTLVGTTAAALLLESATTRPPAGAAPVNVTVPVDKVPPLTLAGFSDTPDRARGGVTPSTTLVVPPAGMVNVDVFWPEYDWQDPPEHTPVTGMFAALVVVSWKPTPGVSTPVAPDAL